MNRGRRLFLGGLALALVTVSACGKDEQKPQGPPPTMVTTAPAQAQNLQITQESIGSVDTQTAPFVAAEVAGRVTRLAVNVGEHVRAGQVLAELDPRDQQLTRQAAAAELNRVQALLRNQQRLVERYQKLVQQGFVSETALDNAESQLAAYREQAHAAQAQLEAAQRNLARTKIVAPITGRVEQRMVAIGDFVTVGKAVFQLTSSQTLRVHLPFPETLAAQLRPGQAARLSTPTAPGKTVEGRVSEIRPMVGVGSRSIDVIVDVPNPGDWRSGASVNGAIVVGERPNAVTVPEQSVVLRPAGEVVYVLNAGKAEQRVVQTGLRQGGLVEIQSGVKAGETVIVDGASFLTDKAPVAVQKTAPAKTPASAAAPPAGATR